MKYLTTGDLRNANAVLQYAVEQEVQSVKTTGPTKKGWYIVELDCTILQYERIFGFLEGLELLQ